VYIVKPTDTSLHQAYTFYTKISAAGGSYAWFGPFTLNVGCFAASVTLTASSFFDPTLNKAVGFPVANAYTFYNPTSSRSWCTHVSNTIVNNDATGTAWSGAAKISGTGT